jgi:hypothetical protein
MFSRCFTFLAMNALRTGRGVLAIPAQLLQPSKMTSGELYIRSLQIPACQHAGM